NVRLVGQGHSSFPMPASIIEGSPDNAFDPVSGVNFLLDSQFGVGAALKVSANVDVDSLGILAKDDEVDVFTMASLERREKVIEQPDRSKIDIEIQAKTQSGQNIDRMLIRWDTGIAEGAGENSIEVLPKHFERTIR